MRAKGDEAGKPEVEKECRILSRLIISVSGLRGVVGETLTPEIAARYARAFARQLSAGPLVLARDSRPSGRMLLDAIRSSLHAVGRDTIDAGIAATPTVGFFLRQESAAGAIQVSASHNPAPYNGMKLFGADGAVIDAARGDTVRTYYEEDRPCWVSFDRLGSSRMAEDPHAGHLQAVLALVDREAVTGRRFRVLLDSNHGAGSLLGRRLLEELGCDVTLLGEVADGQFAHPPEPTRSNLAEVGGQVVSSGAAVGFCQDPDADRLAIIDERGRYIGEEMTLALCLKHVLARRPGPIAINCATSRMAVDLARQVGAECHLAAVGEANVVAMMRKTDAVFGGEGNGGPIDPRVGFVRDSFVGMALVLDAMALENKTVSQLVEAIPAYAIVKRTVDASGQSLEEAFRRLESHFSGARSNRMDGLRLDWDHRWLLVRPSNTEPIVRLIAEAQTESEAAGLCDEAAEVFSTK